MYNTVGAELACRFDGDRRQLTGALEFVPGGRTLPSGLFQNPLVELPVVSLDGNPTLPDHMLVSFKDMPAGRSTMNLPRLLESHRLWATASLVHTYVSSCRRK